MIEFVIVMVVCSLLWWCNKSSASLCRPPAGIDGRLLPGQTVSVIVRSNGTTQLDRQDRGGVSICLTSLWDEELTPQLLIPPI